MRRIVCTKVGSLDHLEVEERRDLEPRPGQIVVDVEAAGVTAVDALIVLGDYPLQVPAPFVPGHEIAGTVRAVGEGAAGFDVGDRVLSLQGMGGFTTQVALQPFLAMRVPDGLGTPEAGSLLQAYSTALIALEHRLAVQPGERVLIIGAGGGVGLALVDVARAMGATVLAAASTDAKRELARSAGAVATIDHETEDLRARARELAKEHGGSLDVVVDLVGGRHSPAALTALGSRGRYGVLGLAGGAAALPSDQILSRNRSVVGIDCGDFSIRDGVAYYQVMQKTVAWAADGTIRPCQPTARPLEAAAATLSDLLGRRVAGKVVLVP